MPTVTSSAESTERSRDAIAPAIIPSLRRRNHLQSRSTVLLAPSPSPGKFDDRASALLDIEMDRSHERQQGSRGIGILLLDCTLKSPTQEEKGPGTYALSSSSPSYVYTGSKLEII
ncbi:hypothetical protein KP509_13G031300 [Ceratopteris richardii]|uniref:Uncharacterized protein n=1 Tax=Ceratopteris richardii TaxID=49495 RepID=A0A8T2TJY9_CERRI|nr:hypothetical protein KP509_13G031300 [Ceratopteris richardii]